MANIPWFRQVRFGRRLARGAGVAGALLVLLCPLVSAAATQWLDRAEFSAGLPGAGTTVRSQRLPHAWWDHDPELMGEAWYTLRFVLPGQPEGPQALFLSAITVPADVHVNGELVGSVGPPSGQRPRSYEQAPRFAVSPGLLHAGENTLVVRVRVNRPGAAGIGPILFGDYEGVRRVALWNLVVHTLAPAAIAVVNVTVGIFMLFLWLRRREPSHVGLFAVAAILWGIHTAITLLPELPIPQPHYFIWWHGMYLTFVVMLCLFCVRFAGCAWRRYERFAVAYAALVVPALYACLPFGIEGDASSVIRLGGILLVVIALAGVGRYVLQHRSIDSRLLLATGVLSAAFALHDWFDSLATDMVRPVYLVPYAALAFLLFVGWILVDRFGRALSAAERSKAILEARVAEKSAALSEQLERTQAARDEAEAANRAKSRFLAAASHDLRQPLHALGLLSSGLTASGGESDRLLVGRRIQKLVDSLEALLSSLLDVSRLDAGAIVARIEPVELDALFDRVANDFAPEALERGLTLSIVATDAWIQTDAVLFERILRNLVSNALRYTVRGGVLVGCRRSGTRVAVQVWDTGRGIDAVERERIFEEFYRPEAEQVRAAGGLGLGLSIVRRLCVLLGHELAFSSRPGRGTMFSVTAVRVSPPTRQLTPYDGLGSLAGKRILVIDDEAPVREGMQRLLAGWGCEPLVVPDTAAALAAAGAAGMVDAIVADYRLANGEDGLDAVLLLRSDLGVAVPTLVVTGESRPEALDRINAAGLTVVHKPVSPARLRSLMVWLLSPPQAAG